MIAPWRAPVGVDVKPQMRRFYACWFFFCAGWGYLMAQFSSEAGGNSVLAMVGSLPAGVLTLFILMSIELWRLPPGKRVPGPSLDLKPWHLPFGIPVFVFVTFLFSSIWGLLIALAVPDSFLFYPAQMLMLSAGGLVGLKLASHVFSARIAA